MPDIALPDLGYVRAMAEAAVVNPEAFDLSVLTGHLLRLLDATEAALGCHQEHEGRCTACIESCNCVGDAYGPLIGSELPAAEVRKIVCEAWESCPHGSEPWPCVEYRAITTALLGEES